LGTAHPEVATSLNNLAFVVHAQRDWDPAAGIGGAPSRLAVDIPLIRRNLAPISFVDVPDDTYTFGMLDGVRHVDLPLCAALERPPRRQRMSPRAFACRPRLTELDQRGPRCALRHVGGDRALLRKRGRRSRFLTIQGLVQASLKRSRFDLSRRRDPPQVGYLCTRCRVVWCGGATIPGDLLTAPGASPLSHEFGLHRLTQAVATGMAGGHMGQAALLAVAASMALARPDSAQWRH
jgi:hypothetical protein